MRYLFIAILLLCGTVNSAVAQISVSIGINVPQYPALVRVPGYPVYYAPQVDSNFFFYDGMYWVYQDDNWYASDWYNGPWGRVGPEAVPLFVLRIPVRYYRAPPPYFRDWRREAPPRWGDHWGRDWEQRRSGWDRWNHRAAPAPAPLPSYQRRYTGDRYPRQVEQQQALRNQNYRYQPRAPEVRQRHESQQAQAPAARPPAQQNHTSDTSPDRSQRPGMQRPNSSVNSAPAASPRPQPRINDGAEQATPREQRAPEPRARESARVNERPRQEPNRGQGQGPDRNRGDDRGGDRGR
jgi:hypothetical protein